MKSKDAHACRRFSRGFTLIELLVVVAIIALLISITMPALSHARDQSKATRCAANIHSLNEALVVYTAEWENCIPVNGIIMPKVPTGGTQGIPQRYQGTPLAQPPFTDTNTNDAVPSYGVLWKMMHGVVNPPGTTTATYIGNLRTVYCCPSDDFVRTNGGTSPAGFGNSPLLLANDNYTVSAKGTASANGTGYYSYSVNTVLNSLGRFRDQFQNGTTGAAASGGSAYADLYQYQLPWGDPLKTTSIKNPSLFLFFIEEDDNSQFNDEIVEPPAFAPTTNYLTGRHFGRGNIGFGDGRVEAVKSTDFNVPLGTTKPSTTTGAMQILMTRNFFPDMGAFSDNGP